MIKEIIAVEGAKSLIQNLVKEMVIPKMQEFAQKSKLKYEELLIPRGEHFEEYLLRTYEQYSIITTLALNNSQRRLKDLYVPLTLVKENNQREFDKTVVIDKFPVDFVKTYKKILISDTAGMGKSTLTKRLFLDVIENGHGIPVYIELRRLEKNKSILQYIQSQLNSLTKDFNNDLLLTFIQTGGFVFFLDGFDEISLENRSEVTEMIQDFVSKAGNNVFFLTSRPEQALSCFGDFQLFTINSLEKEEAYQLLKNYDGQGPISQALISELESGKYEMIDEFLKNPLLVSLLFIAYNHKNKVPIEKHIFYRNVYDAFFENHDLTKGGNSDIHKKRSGLNIENFERVLRHVGYISLKTQKVEFEKDALLDIIREAKKSCMDLKFEASDFFRDLLTAVPLFCQDGQYYRWVHKSLQEYFAAQFIYKDSDKSKDAILSTMYSSEKLEKYINLLDLYYDIDNWGFRKNILLPLCESYIEFHNNNLFSSITVQKCEIERRISLLFMREACFYCESHLNKKKKSENELFDDDLFGNINKKIQPHLSRPISLISHDTSGFTCFGFDTKHAVLQLLKRRQDNLFIPLKNTQTKYDLPRNVVIKIDMHTFENKNDSYKMLNDLLEISSPDLFNCFLEYKQCNKEIQNIKETINKKENTSVLLEGL